MTRARDHFLPRGRRNGKVTSTPTHAAFSNVKIGEQKRCSGWEETNSYLRNILGILTIVSSIAGQARYKTGKEFDGPMLCSSSVGS